MQIIQPQGARPRFSPTSNHIVFDRKNTDGYYDLYISDLKGNIINSLTDGKTGITQRNNGNGVFDPTGRYVVFVSEEASHFGEKSKYYGDPGVGLFSNLWAADILGEHFWKLSNVPVKQKLSDGIPAYAVVNPHFSIDGKLLIWSERYAEGGHNNWGKWRVLGADFVIENNAPHLENARTLFEPSVGNYVTFMGELPSGDWILAGNLDGQHEYGMDQYRYDPQSKDLVNLQNTPLLWEEDASVSPGSTIVYMTNADSPFAYDFDNPNWPSQPMEREYYRMDADGRHKQRLTFFNDTTAPEYTGKRVIVAASDFSPDGRYLAGTIGVNFGTDERRDVVLKIILIEFDTPF